MASGACPHVVILRLSRDELLDLTLDMYAWDPPGDVVRRRLGVPSQTALEEQPREPTA